MDELTAWQALLSLEPGEVGAVGPLTFEADGSWRSSLEPEPAAATMLDLLGPLRTTPRFTVGQLGQSVDGRIATAAGHSHYINGPEDLTRLHRLRALVQAVVVGAGTVASDDPRLTVRRVDGSDPVRVVLDPSGRLDRGHAVFADGAAPTLWLQAEGGRGVEGVSAGVEVARLPAPAGRFDPITVLTLLEGRGLTRVLVEGGGLTVSSFLAARALDRLHISVAPLLMGSGRPSITLPPIETLDEAIRPGVRHFRLGDDLLFDLELRQLRS